MTEQLDPSTVERVFARAGIDFDVVSASPLLLISADRPSIVWANGLAAALLGAAHEREASRRLFRSGPSSLALINRLRRMASGPEPRLDRLVISRGFQVIPQMVACRAVEGLASEALILVQFVNTETDDGTALPRFQSALDPEPVEQASVAVHPPLAPASGADVAEGLRTRFSGRRVLRVVWEADRHGVVTHVDPDFAAAVGASALGIGDDVVARLRILDPAVGDALATSVAARRTVTGLRVAWPVTEAAAAVLVTLGCVFRAGEAAGLRGFCQIHTDQVTDLAPVRPQEAAEDPQSETEGSVADRIEAPEHGSADNTPVDPPAQAAASGGVSEPPPQSLAPDLERADANLPPHAESVGEPAIGHGNIVHFPTLKIPSVFVGPARESRPADPPRPVPPVLEGDLSNLPPPQWSESPVAPAQLTTDEQDAFDHIRKVLGTRPVSTPVPETVAADAAPALDAPPPDEPEHAFRAVLPVIDALPVGAMLHRNKDLIHVNAALFSALDATSMAEIQVDVDHSNTPDAIGDVSPFVLTSPAGKILTGEARTILLGGVPATLVTFPRGRDAKQDDEIAALHAEQRRLAALGYETVSALAMSADGVGFIDDRGTIGWASAGAEELFGYRTGELVGKTGTGLLMADQDASWRSLLAAVTDEASSHPVSGSLLGRTREGGLVPLQIRLGRVAPSKFCVVWTDDSSRKRAENGLEAARREAERANTLKSEFLAKVSHEIRTPLNAILGFAEVIMDERLGPIGNARYAEYLKDIHASGAHVMSLVNDLLDLSRIEAGRLDLKLEAVDANSVVGACVNTLQTQAHRERVIVRLSLSPRLPPALADERSLRQIVLNLLSNAIKFNEPGGQVIVSTAVTDAETIAIRIRDTGLGMSDEDIEIAMEPFRQLPTGKTGGGSGLGLPLTKALVEASCASMTIKSRPGEGTLVEILFPVVEQEPLSVLAQ